MEPELESIPGRDRPLERNRGFHRMSEGPVGPLESMGWPAEAGSRKSCRPWWPCAV